MTKQFIEYQTDSLEAGHAPSLHFPISINTKCGFTDLFPIAVETSPYAILPLFLLHIALPTKFPIFVAYQLFE
jgi:hypothetical protein